MTLAAALLLAALAALAAAEISVRAIGLVDFPLYRLDPEIEYFTAPNQAGSFLRKNDWRFNDRSMPIERDWDPGAHPNLLLIGNSVVMGGNPFRQKDKLPSMLQETFGGRRTVWPMAVGGWTQVNEMAYLAKNTDVIANADGFAWEYMRGGLHAGTPWAGEYVFPTRRPSIATWYVVRRYVLPKILSRVSASELPITGAPVRSVVLRFDQTVSELVGGKGGEDRKRKGLIWLYPKATELELARSGREWLPERPEIEAIASRHGLTIVDIAADPRWRTDLYARGGVHPTVEGNAALASILYDALRDLAVQLS